VAIRSTDSQVFILMRHGEAEKGPDGELDEKGVMQARKAAAVVHELAGNLGKSDINLIASPMIRAWQTVQVMAKSLKIGSPQEIEVRLRDRDRPEMPKEEQKVYKGHLKETNAEQFGRMKRGIVRQLEARDASTLPVLVAHQSSMHAFFEGLACNDQLGGAKESFLPKVQNGEIFVVERRGDQFIALERRPISPAKL
jgi:phosphohistidine phosphatase SixA